MKQKALRLAIPGTVSMRTALIYSGDIDPAVARQGYFDYCVPFETLLTARASV